MNGKTYEDGLRDGIGKFGGFCASHGDCSSCAVHALIPVGETCPVYISHSPASVLTLIDGQDESYSYYNEFCNRFPNAGLSVEVLANSACRKVVFEGYTECAGGDCEKCWQEHYTGDITNPSSNNTSGVSSGSNEDEILSLFGEPQQTVPTGNNIDNSFTNFDFLGE